MSKKSPSGLNCMFASRTMTSKLECGYCLRWPCMWRLSVTSTAVGHVHVMHSAYYNSRGCTLKKKSTVDGEVGVFYPLQLDTHVRTHKHSLHTHTSPNGSSILLSFFSALFNFLWAPTDWDPVFVDTLSTRGARSTLDLLCRSSPVHINFYYL